MDWCGWVVDWCGWVVDGLCGWVDVDWIGSVDGLDQWIDGGLRGWVSGEVVVLSEKLIRELMINTVCQSIQHTI